MKYAVLIGWISESDGACGERTDFSGVEDLVAAYRRCKETGEVSENFGFQEVEHDDPNAAYALGIMEFFFEDWTATDSLTAIIDSETYEII